LFVHKTHIQTAAHINKQNKSINKYINRPPIINHYYKRTPVYFNYTFKTNPQLEMLQNVVNEEYGADEYQAEEYDVVCDGDDGDVRDGNDFYDSRMQYGGYRSFES
jgi:hypothetical protein